MKMLEDLPEAHPFRNRPLKDGAQFRVWCTKGQDITVPFHERGKDWTTCGWGQWRTVLEKWKIGCKTFNELGASWKENVQWRFQSEI